MGSLNKGRREQVTTVKKNVPPGTKARVKSGNANPPAQVGRVNRPDLPPCETRVGSVDPTYNFFFA